jgi:hypothetical protein
LADIRCFKTDSFSRISNKTTGVIINYKQHTEYRIANTRQLCMHKHAHICTRVRMCVLSDSPLQSFHFSLMINLQSAIYTWCTKFTITIFNNKKNANFLIISFTSHTSDIAYLRNINTPKQYKYFNKKVRRGVPQLRRLDGSSDTIWGQVMLVEKLALGRIFSKYLGFPGQFSLH